MSENDEATDEFAQPCVVAPRAPGPALGGQPGAQDSAHFPTRAGLDGDFLAWVARLVHTHRTRLARVAQREGLTADLAFDAVQEAFVTFIDLPKARHLIDDADAARKLLVTLVRNVARNARRRHAEARPHLRDAITFDEVAADSASVEALLVAAEDHVRLAGCLRTLAEIPRTVIILRMLDEVPGEDVARTLGLSASHVAVLLHRAKASLLACMTGVATGAGPSAATETQSLRSNSPGKR